MKFGLYFNLWKAKQDLQPNSNFKRALWNRLAIQWDSKKFPEYLWYQRLTFKVSVAILIGALVTSSIGTGAYAYTSPKVTEGTVLYPLKQKLEALEEKTKLTEEKKAEFLLKKAERREAELKVLEKRQIRKNVNIEKQIKKTGDKISDIEKTLIEVDKKIENISNKNEKIKEKIKQRLEKSKKHLKTAN